MRGGGVDDLKCSASNALKALDLPHVLYHLKILSYLAMEYIQSKPIPEKCEPVKCEGLNCTVAENQSGCPTCTCKAPCPTPECQEGCEIEKSVKEPGRCPRCVCKLSRSARGMYFKNLIL